MENERFGNDWLTLLKANKSTNTQSIAGFMGVLKGAPLGNDNARKDRRIHDAPGGVVYHGTTTNVVRSILADGLKPQDKRYRVWQQEGYQEGDRSNNVFATADKKNAQDYAAYAMESQRSKMLETFLEFNRNDPITPELRKKMNEVQAILLTIKVPAGKKGDFVNDEQDEKSVRTTKAIPPEWIQKVEVATMSGGKPQFKTVTVQDLLQVKDEGFTVYTVVIPDDAEAVTKGAPFGNDNAKGPHKMHRGVGDESSTSGTMTWVTPDKDIAQGYANKRNNGRVESVDTDLKNTLDLGHDARELTPSQFAIQAMTKAKGISPLTDKEMLALRADFVKGQPTTPTKISDLWAGEDGKKRVSTLLTGLGFDSVHLLEEGKPTYGLLKKHETQSIAGFTELLKGAPLGNDNAAGPHNTQNKTAKIRAGADKIKAMSEAERDDLDPATVGYEAYVLYESEKLMPKKDGQFKTLTGNNSFKAHEEADAVVNVDGKPHLATLIDDPDDEGDGQDLRVWHFSDPANPIEDKGFQSAWADKADAHHEYKSYLKTRITKGAPYGNDNAAKDHKPGGKNSTANNARDPNKTYDGKDIPTHTVAAVAAGIAELESKGITVQYSAEDFHAATLGRVHPVDIVKKIWGEDEYANGDVQNASIVQHRGGGDFEHLRGSVSIAGGPGGKVYGAPIDFVERNLLPGMQTIDHTYLKISDGDSNTGAIKKMFTEVVPEYKKMGIKEITLHANLEAGAYAWSKYGFAADHPQHVTKMVEEGWANLIKHANEGVPKEYRPKLSTQATKEMEGLRDIMANGGKYAGTALATFPTPHLDKHFGHVFGAAKDQRIPDDIPMTFMKTVMSGKHWNATHSFDDPRSAKQLSDYLTTKPKPKLP